MNPSARKTPAGHTTSKTQVTKLGGPLGRGPLMLYARARWFAVCNSVPLNKMSRTIGPKNQGKERHTTVIGHTTPQQHGERHKNSSIPPYIPPYTSLQTSFHTILDAYIPTIGWRGSCVSHFFNPSLYTSLQTSPQTSFHTIEIST